MVTQRATTNFSASPYTAAEETGPEVIWARCPPLGHNMGPITRLSGRGMKPDVLQSAAWHKTDYSGRVGAEGSSFPYPTCTYRRGQLGKTLFWAPASPEKINTSYDRFRILKTWGDTDMPDAKGIWKTQGHWLTRLSIAGGSYRIFQQDLKSLKKILRCVIVFDNPTLLAERCTLVWTGWKTASKEENSLHTLTSLIPERRSLI